MLALTIAKADREKRSEIERLAARLEPSIADAVRAALEEHGDRLSLADLEAAIRAGDQRRVLEIVGQVDPVRAQAVRQTLEDAVWAGGALAQIQAPALKEARILFNRLNPDLVRWLEQYSLNLIREIDAGTTEAVRAALIKGMTEGRNPIDQARQIKAVVGLTAKQARAVMSYQRELETFHLRRSAKRWGLGRERSVQSGLEVFRRDANGRPADGIYERRLRDQRFDPTLQRAMETKKPLTPQQIAKMVAAYQRRALQNRARTIARTESIRAANVGAFEAWRQAIANGQIDGALVRKFWRVSADERLCARCSGIAKAVPKRGVPLEAYFDDPVGRQPVKLPPAHPSCRCYLQFRLFEAIQLQE